MNDAYVGCDLPSLDQQLMKVRAQLLPSESLLFLPSEALRYLAKMDQTRGVAKGGGSWGARDPPPPLL